MASGVEIEIKKWIHLPSFGGRSKNVGFRNFVCSPPPSYQEVYAAERDQPPTYEDVVKLDADKKNVQTQDDEDDQIEINEPEEETGHHDDQQMNDFLQHENQDNPEINTNDEVSENPAVEIES